MAVELLTRQGREWRTLRSLMEQYLADNPISSDQIDWVPGSIPGDALEPGAVQSNAPQYIDSRVNGLGVNPSTAFQTVFDLSTNASLMTGEEAFIFLSAKLKGKIKGTRKRTALVILELAGKELARVAIPFSKTQNKVIAKSTAVIFTASTDLDGTLRVRIKESGNNTASSTLTVNGPGSSVSCYVTMPDSA